MKHIMFFCIPAHGHTNPMLPAAKELVDRGHAVRFYSFKEFKEKIEKTGAVFISCDRYLPDVTEKELERIKKISTTEMTITDIRTTINMDPFLQKEVEEFKPDVIYTDSVAFWGKLTAWKYKIPMVCSTSTFAFNRMSSQYMKMSAGEMADMILGLPKISRELKKLEPYGYHVDNALSLVQNDNDTDTVVYTSKKFQPFAETFSGHYAFVGPSVFSDAKPDKAKDKPLIYISMGTVINERPDFYHKCIEALKDKDVEVVISCGRYMDMKELGTLPDSVRAYPYVDQLDILSRADAFITHCGMNSVSESLYMATPMVLYPQTSEQYAVARRTEETGAGVLLKDDSAAGIRKAVDLLLQNHAYADAAMECSQDFRSCPGAAGAAEFIETAPHIINENTDENSKTIKEFHQRLVRFRVAYWIVAAILLVLFAVFVNPKYTWIAGVAAGVLSAPIEGIYRRRQSDKL